MKIQCFDANGEASSVTETEHFAVAAEGLQSDKKWETMLVESGKKQTSYCRNDDGEWACYEWGKNKLGLKFA